MYVSCEFPYYTTQAYLVAVSGTGLFACQLAKNVFKAGKVITTVSTSKVPQVKELLGDGVVDESKEFKFSRFPPTLTNESMTSHRLQKNGSKDRHPSAVGRLSFRYDRRLYDLSVADATDRRHSLNLHPDFRRYLAKLESHAIVA